MSVKGWTVCLIEPNRFESQIILDMLRDAGVEKMQAFADAGEATQALESFSANVVVAAFEMAPLDGAAWTRAFRRNDQVADRRAAVFITSAAFSRSMAEECRHAGANALIGKPLSSEMLLATINKVLDKPRPFVEGTRYVGPCRRAGIVTAGAPRPRRRDRDSSPVAPAAGPALQQGLEALRAATAKFALDFSDREACEAALHFVQSYAANSGDGPLMRACAAFALQLGVSGDLRPEAVRAALDVCVNGVTELAMTPMGQGARREALAEAVREAVGRAAQQRAA
jgi:CheY-like chemotaxis protein